MSDATYGNTIPSIVNRDEVLEKITEFLENQEPMDTISEWLSYNMKLQINIPEHSISLQLLLCDALGEITIETPARTIRIETNVESQDRLSIDVSRLILEASIIAEAEELTREAVAKGNKS